MFLAVLVVAGIGRGPNLDYLGEQGFFWVFLDWIIKLMGGTSLLVPVFAPGNTVCTVMDRGEGRQRDDSTMRLQRTEGIGAGVEFHLCASRLAVLMKLDGEVVGQWRSVDLAI